MLLLSTVGWVALARISTGAFVVAEYRVAVNPIGQSSSSTLAEKKNSVGCFPLTKKDSVVLVDVPFQEPRGRNFSFSMKNGFGAPPEVVLLCPLTNFDLTGVGAAFRAGVATNFRQSTVGSGLATTGFGVAVATGTGVGTGDED